MKHISFLFGLLLATSVTANPVENLDPVGSATLKVMFWTIYDSNLYTPDGSYRGIEPDLALEISYRRNISARRLINQTREEWQSQGIYTESFENWLDSLIQLWPDVRRGDVIVLKVDEKLASNFYLNDELIGRIGDAEFTNNFLSIWLSERSSYPKLRNRLVGA